VTTTTARTRPTGTGSDTDRKRGALIVLMVVAVSAVTSVLALAIGGALAPAPAGLPDAGATVRIGIPVLRSAFDVFAALTIGLLVLAAFVVGPERSAKDPLDLDGVRRHAVRLAALAATSWLAVAIALLVFTYADVAGTPFDSPGFAEQLNFYIREIDLGRSAFVVIVMVMLVAAGASGATRVFATGWLAGIAIASLFPVALAGHAAGSTDHQNAVNSLFVHLIGATVWVGGLIGLLLLASRLGRQTASVVERYSLVATWAFVAVAVSGVINAAIRIGSIDNLASEYGLLVLFKVAALVGLGFAGWQQRRAVLPGLRESATRRAAFVRLALTEVVVMAFAFGIAVALSRTATPVPELEAEDPLVALVGFPMPPAQSTSTMFSLTYVDYLWLAIAGLLAGGYLVGLLKLRRGGHAWPWLRTVSWFAGCVVLAWATSGGPAVYGRINFSGHMLQHMTLMMIVPILLVLGAPMTIALRTLRARTDQSTGPREWLLAVLHSRFLRVVSNPIVAAVLFIGSLVGFYFTALFGIALETHTGHILMTVHFLLVGYLFVWVLIGIDPGPPRPPYPFRLLLLLATVSFHAFFGLALTSADTILAPQWWEQVGRVDAAELLSDQRLGGGIAWSFGELPTLFLIVAIGIQWAMSDTREAKRLDRKADRDGDAELAAYNAALTARASSAERERAERDRSSPS
jgi:putative copper resistance protein D